MNSQRNRRSQWTAVIRALVAITGMGFSSGALAGPATFAMSNGTTSGVSFGLHSETGHLLLILVPAGRTVVVETGMLGLNSVSIYNTVGDTLLWDTAVDGGPTGLDFTVEAQLDLVSLYWTGAGVGDGYARKAGNELRTALLLLCFGAGAFVGWHLLAPLEVT